MNESAHTYRYQGVLVSDLIDSVRAKLDEPDGRIVSEVREITAFSWWWPDEINGGTALLAAMDAIESKYPELENVSMDEVGAIYHALVDSGFRPKLASYQTLTPGSIELYTGRETRAHALRLWDLIGIPIQRVGDMLYHFTSSPDVFGTPIIREISVEEYVRACGNQLAARTASRATLGVNRDRWRSAASLALGTLVLIGLFWVVRF